MVLSKTRDQSMIRPSFPLVSYVAEPMLRQEWEIDKSPKHRLLSVGVTADHKSHRPILLTRTEESPRKLVQFSQKARKEFGVSDEEFIKSPRRDSS
jgi:hypothetical protein